MKNSQQGFGVLGVLVALALVGVIGFAGWQLWDKKYSDKTPVASTKVTPPSVPEEYKRTTTIPSEWKIYEDDRYPISFSYPADWRVIPDFNKDDPTNNGAYKIAAGSSPSGQYYETAIGIKAQPLEDAISIHKPPRETRNKLLSEKDITFDGHIAKEIRVQFMSGPSDNPVPGTIVRYYYVFANGNTYRLPEVFEDESAARSSGINFPTEYMTIFESIKISY